MGPEINFCCVCLHHVIELQPTDENVSSALTDTTPGNRKPLCLLSLHPVNPDNLRGGGVRAPITHHLRPPLPPKTFLTLLSACIVNTEDTHPYVGDSGVRGHSSQFVFRQVCLLHDITVLGGVFVSPERAD